MQMKYFSIVVVALNPGEKMQKTLQSIANQTFTDYEVIIKDGGSQDGSLELARKSAYYDKLTEVRIIEKKDNSIYDGMNQALAVTKGRYIQFLNCGDSYYSDTVLEEIFAFIKENEEEKIPFIFYGNQYNLLQKSIVTSAPTMNDFACFRNVPCHQVCFYDFRLFRERAYKIQYTVRADYEHFLYSIYEKRAKAIHTEVTVCNYEGGGYSETKENRKKSKEQHRVITDQYLGVKAKLYRLVMLLTFSGLRTKMAESKSFSVFYNGFKSFIYKMIR